MRNICGVFENKNVTPQTRMVTGFPDFVAFVASLKPHPLYIFFITPKQKIQKNKRYFSIKIIFIFWDKNYSIIDLVKKCHKRHNTSQTLVFTGLRPVANFFNKNKKRHRVPVNPWFYWISLWHFFEAKTPQFATKP